MRLTHIGGPTVLVELRGWRVLTDPTFDPPGRRYAFGWGTSSTKTSGPVLEESLDGDIDVVLLSHDHHADNLDDAGRKLLPRATTVVTTRPGARRLAADNVIGLDPGETTRIAAAGRPTLEITATPGRHGPPLSRPIAGAVIGFAVREVGRTAVSLWMSGDTVMFGGLRRVARAMDVDVALLHLGSVRFPITGPLRYSMGGSDAVTLIELLQPRVAVPVHFEGWSHFTEQEAALHHVLETAPDDVRQRLRWLLRGQSQEM